MPCLNKTILTCLLGLFLSTGKLYAETEDQLIKYIPLDDEPIEEPVSHSTHANGYLSISGFGEIDGNRSGLELSMIGVSDKIWGFKVSGVLYEGKSVSGLNDIFAGFSFTPFLHLDSDISPYIGAGVFVGDTFNCTDEDEKNGTCNEDIVIAAYPEVGFIIKNKFIFLSFFVRRYFDTNDSASTINANGFSFGFKF